MPFGIMTTKCCTSPSGLGEKLAIAAVGHVIRDLELRLAGT